MITVGIGEYAMTNNQKEKIITHALGSCVAFIIRCPISQNTALAHIVLPTLDRNDQFKYLDTKPSYFADFIIPKLIDEFLINKKCEKTQLQVLLTGGAHSLNPNDMFHVGERNLQMIEKILDNYGILPKKIEVGGTKSRTVEVNVADGEVIINSQNMRI